MGPTTNVPLAALALLGAALLAGCQSNGQKKKDIYQRQLARLEADYARLEQQKAELWRVGKTPQVFDFEGQGRVTVLEWELVGYPGEEYVQVRLTYQNTTDVVKETAFVWLDVLDSGDQIAGSTAIQVMNPMGYPFWTGHSYTTEIKAATNGAHLDPEGWGWTIACEAQTDPDPGTKPVLINHDLERARDQWRLVYSASGAFGTNAPAAGLPPGPHVPGTTSW